MKRLAALALALSLLAIPACAQRGGSRGGFGGHASPAFHSGFGASGARGFSGASRGFAPQYAGSRFAAVPAYRGGVSAARPSFYSNHRGRRPSGYRGSYGFAAPYAYSGYGYAGAYLSPYELGYPDFFGYDDDYDPAATGGQAGDYPNGPYVDGSYAAGPEQPYLDEQAQPYPDEQAQAYAGEQPAPYPQPPYGPYAQAYGPSAAPPQPSRAAAPAPPAPEDAVTIIFKDGHSEQIHNYALTRTTLYITGARVHEVPLAEINLPATEKANQDAGVDFKLPTAQ